MFNAADHGTVTLFAFALVNFMPLPSTLMSGRVLEATPLWSLKKSETIPDVSLIESKDQ
jgi:hypothetical protein